VRKSSGTYRRRRRLWLTFIAPLLVGGLCGAARAEGGASIASAPAVTYGQQEFSNMAGGSHVTAECGLFGGFGGCCESYYHQFWSLSVLAGDMLTIDWESELPELELKLVPVGTTDFTLNKNKPVAEQQLENNGKNELKYRAPQSGSLPMDFKLCKVAPGPYDFTVYVSHTVRLFLDRRAKLPTRGTVAVSVRTLDGSPISDSALEVKLQVELHGHWHTVGSSQVSSGVANVPYRLARKQRHRRVDLRAMAQGPSYQVAVSAVIATGVVT
jgi:hypothetical protein